MSMNTLRRVRTRFAPSPTGFLHIGGVRTALYNELVARQSEGDFILRIEDTDQTRFVEGATEDICVSLKRIGILPNEGVWIDDDGKIFERGLYGPYTQSKRTEKHRAYAQQLVEMRRAYYCFCSSERLDDLRKTQTLAHIPTMYDGACRTLSVEDIQSKLASGEKHVIRLKLLREGTIQMQDAILGEIKFDWSLIDDQIIIKSDGFATYHLAAMCDDHDMEITHVIRANEWVASTPKHIFIYESFGWELPIFAHLPLLLNPDHSKLSKRQGDVAAHEYIDKGYMPEALINFLSLLGFNPTGDRELYSHEELISLFDLTKVNKAGAVFNAEKLHWMNEQYIRILPIEKYIALTREFIVTEEKDEIFIQRCLIGVRDRISLPSQVVELVQPFLQQDIEYSQVSIAWKKQTLDEARNRLIALREIIVGLEDMSVSELEAYIKNSISEKKWVVGETLWPLRVALSGEEKSSSPFELLWILGKERSLKRIDSAIDFLKG